MKLTNYHRNGGGRKLATLLSALLLVGMQFAAGDTYQYIISGTPVANESYAANSPASSLASATRRDGSAASPMEARYRTWDESDGIPFRSDKFKAMMIIFR